MELAVADPRDDDVRGLLERHLAFARATTPPEDVYALDVGGLLAPEVTLFALREEGRVLAVGALKELGGGEGEIKSMHTAAEARGRGLARAVLDHLLDVARERGLRRVSLETGAGEAFAPARTLYAAAGFVPCGAFGAYASSPNSAYMTLPLSG